MDNIKCRSFGWKARTLILSIILLALICSPAYALTLNWPMDEGVNNAIHGYADLGSVYDQNATLQGGATGWLSGSDCMDSNCYNFSGETAIIPDSYLHLDNWTAFTLGVWVNKSTQHGYFFSDGHMTLRSDGHSFACGLEDDVLINTSVYVIDDGVYHHLACSWNDSCLNIYVNGVLNGQTCQTHTPTDRTGNVCFGSNCGGGGIEQKTMDAFFLADYAMTDGEIYSIYDANDGAPTTTEVTTTVETTSSSELSSSSSEASSTSSELSSSSSIVYATTSSSERSSSSSSAASTTSSSSFESSSSQLASTSSSALSSSSSSMGSSSTSSVISSTLVTTTLLECDGDYSLACIILNETVCGDYYTSYEYTSYQCVWNEADDGFCDLITDPCTVGSLPSCQDYEVDECYEAYSEEECEGSYVAYYGEGTAYYNCQWIFGYCYEEYQQCEVILGECPSEYSYACPLINESRECINSYSTWDGYHYQCEWVIDEEYGDYCWFGPNCEKLTYDQCQAESVEDCYILGTQEECEESYWEGRGDYGYNCIWFEDYCYYGDDCHEGSPVTTTIPTQTLYDVVEGLPEVGSAITSFVIAFVQVILALIIVSAIAELFNKFGNGLKLR